MIAEQTMYIVVNAHRLLRSHVECADEQLLSARKKRRIVGIKARHLFSSEAALRIAKANNLVLHEYVRGGVIISECEPCLCAVVEVRMT